VTNLRGWVNGVSDILAQAIQRKLLFLPRMWIAFQLGERVAGGGKLQGERGVRTKKLKIWCNPKPKVNIGKNSSIVLGVGGVRRAKNHL
jgi:hypothetical protein